MRDLTSSHLRNVLLLKMSVPDNAIIHLRMMRFSGTSPSRVRPSIPSAAAFLKGIERGGHGTAADALWVGSFANAPGIPWIIHDGHVPDLIECVTEHHGCKSPGGPALLSNMPLFGKWIDLCSISCSPNWRYIANFEENISNINYRTQGVLDKDIWHIYTCCSVFEYLPNHTCIFKRTISLLLIAQQILSKRGLYDLK